MGSIDVRLIRKNRRWELNDRGLFSHANIIDVTMLLSGSVDPQDVHQTCTKDFEGKIFWLFLLTNTFYQKGVVSRQPRIVILKGQWSTQFLCPPSLDHRQSSMRFH